MRFLYLVLCALYLVVRSLAMQSTKNKVQSTISKRTKRKLQFKEYFALAAMLAKHKVPSTKNKYDVRTLLCQLFARSRRLGDRRPGGSPSHRRLPSSPGGPNCPIQRQWPGIPRRGNLRRQAASGSGRPGRIVAGARVAVSVGGGLPRAQRGSQPVAGGEADRAWRRLLRPARNPPERRASGRGEDGEA